MKEEQMNEDGTQEKKKAKNKHAKKKKRKIFRKILLFLLIIFLLTGGVLAYRTYKNGWGLEGFLETIVGNNETTKENLEEFRVLVLGVSTDISAKLTDTIIVASYNPNTQKATLLSIPRDTYVGTNKKKATASNKINALYQSDISKTLEAVNDLTGLNIKNYVVVDTTALIELVDAIGGVEFEVPINMKYDDKSQDLHINLKKGLQHIDGDKAEQLLRFRKNNNGTSYPEEYGGDDIGRMRTQREFITAVVQQTIQAKNILKLGSLLDIANKYVETNVDINVAKKYLPYIIDLDIQNLQNNVLPGVSDKINGIWFYINDEEETEKLINELYNNQNTSSAENNETNTNDANSINNTNTIDEKSENVTNTTQKNTSKK